MAYLVQFAQSHISFRLPEFLAVCHLYNIKVVILDEYSEDSPYLLVDFSNGGNIDAKNILQRAVLVKNIVKIIGISSYRKNRQPELDEEKQINHFSVSNSHSVQKLISSVQEFCRNEGANDLIKWKNSSFKFFINSFGRSIDSDSQFELINKFSFMDLNGEVKLKNPDLEFEMFLDFGEHATIIGKFEPFECYLGVRVVCTDTLKKFNARRQVIKFNVKERKYIGTTSMDAQLSLIMGNMGLCKPGALCYDPFVGTGSLSIISSYYGCFSFGSDIDARQFRGLASGRRRDSPLNVAADAFSNAKQYGVEERVVDFFTCDITHHPWILREDGLFDIILTDPPYGFRAGAKRTGVMSQYISETEREQRLSAKGISKNEISRILRKPRSHLTPEEKASKYPLMVPYHVDNVIDDLLAFAAEHLVIGGRLVYWLPLFSDEEMPDTKYCKQSAKVNIPQHTKLKLVAASEQILSGGWSRKLVTMERIIS